MKGKIVVLFEVCTVISVLPVVWYCYFVLSFDIKKKLKNFAILSRTENCYPGWNSSIYRAQNCPSRVNDYTGLGYRFKRVRYFKFS